MDDDHDPWNEPGHRHPRAQQLMDQAPWDCVDELAPFGSDEGADAYVEYRSWRSENPGQDLMRCIDEGRIDSSVKPAARAAIARQIHGAQDDHRRDLLNKALRAIEEG